MEPNESQWEARGKPEKPKGDPKAARGGPMGSQDSPTTEARGPKRGQGPVKLWLRGTQRPPRLTVVLTTKSARRCSESMKMPDWGL